MLCLQLAHKDIPLAASVIIVYHIIGYLYVTKYFLSCNHLRYLVAGRSICYHRLGNSRIKVRIPEIEYLFDVFWAYHAAFKSPSSAKLK